MSKNTAISTGLFIGAQRRVKSGDAQHPLLGLFTSPHLSERGTSVPLFGRSNQAVNKLWD